MSQAHVKHDVASLYRFVDSVCSGCERKGQYPAYLEPNRIFIDYVCGLGSATKRYLCSLPEKLGRTPANEYNLARQELASLRASWFALHERLKPASDADTLHLPYPLIRALVSRLQEIESFKSTRFVVIHTEQLNYLQVTASSVQRAADNIAGVVGYRKFHQNLGMIGIPYSQSSTLLLNCLIAHEFAHYVYSEKLVATTLKPSLISALNSAFSAVTSLPPGYDVFIPNVLRDWAEELFCDLFAIWLVGPCFSYAFIEIFDLANDLNAAGDLYPVAAAEHAKFLLSHPAHLFRLKQHVSLLERLGWWAEISGSKHHYVRLLSLAKDFVDTQFKVPDELQNYEKELIEALRQFMPAITSEVQKSIGTIESGVKEFHDLQPIVNKYFKLGIVPSSITKKGQDRPTNPKPLTILNVAYQFYLEDLDILIDGIKKQDKESVSHRERWTRRVEMWAMKAIDDYLLLNKVKGV